MRFLSRSVITCVLLLSAPRAGAFTASGQLEIHYINVQQGGSTLIIGPNGTTVLMEAGSDGKGTSEVVPLSLPTIPSGWETARSGPDEDGPTCMRSASWAM